MEIPPQHPITGCISSTRKSLVLPPLWTSPFTRGKGDVMRDNGFSMPRLLARRFGPVIAMILLCLGPAAHAQDCTSDPECDDSSVCNGAEWCDLSGGSPGWCMPGTPILCDDGDPCTVDYCTDPAGDCAADPTPDAETASGPDGLCDTDDDNLDLYGPDGLCGSPDDLIGDGVCALVDNCDDRSNPGQEDADRDGLGNACDDSPCRERGLYAFSGSALYRVDPVTGTATFVASGFPNPRDVAVDSLEAQAVVTSASPDTIHVVDLESGGIVNSIGAADPWAVEFGEASGQAYVLAENALNVFDLFGGLWPIDSSAITPVGLAVDASESTAYVLETVGGIWSIDLGTYTPTFLGSTTFGVGRAMDLDPAETNLYAVDEALGTLDRISLPGGTPFPVPAILVNPQGIALDASGTVAYVTDWTPGYPAISAVDLVTGDVTPLPQDPWEPMEFQGGLELSPRPPAIVSLPVGEAAPPSSGVSVPVVVDDVTGLGVLSVDFTMAFNPAVLSVSSVTPGALIGGCTLTPNLGVPGRAVVSVYCSTELIGAGTIAEIDFNVNGVEGQGSPLTLTSVLLNEGSPQVCGSDGSFVVPVGIEGRVVYYRDDITSTEPSTKPVDAATVALDRLEWDEMFGPLYTPVGSLPTDCAGDFAFNSLPPVKTYRVTPAKSGDFEGAVDPFDAALNAQHVVGLISLTANQSLAADVTGNGSLTSFDSARIAQFSVGSITSFPVAVRAGGDWVFVPAPQGEPGQIVVAPYPPGGQPGRIVYDPIQEPAENQDFHAILFGDVSGNWSGVCGAESAPVGVTEGGGIVSSPAEGSPAVGRGRANGVVSLPSLHAATGEEIRVPVRVEGTDEAIAFLLDLRFDPAVLEPVRAEVGGDAVAFQLQANTGEAGRARLALFSAEPLEAEGELAVITFRVIGKAPARTSLALHGARVNEGRIPVSVREGRVVVTSAPGRD